MTSSPTLGQVIRQRRLEMGLTQEMLAERMGLGVRQAEVSRLEHDRVSLPRKARMEQIARALEIPIGTLLARSGWVGAQEELNQAATVLPPVGLPAAALQMPVHEPESRVLDTTKAPELSSAIARSRELIEQSRKIMHEARLSFEQASTVSVNTRRKVSASREAPETSSR